MGFFDFLKMPDINTGVEQFHSTPNAVLLDVRTREEYAAGRIPGSKNIPLDQLRMTAREVKNHETPLFVYCLSGARSRQAIPALQRMGYANLTNIGGINGYRGTVER